jgi:hypothetical protein
VTVVTIPKIVTEEGFPTGVCCGNCQREIPLGATYKNRDLNTARLSTGPCTEDRADGIFCEEC